MPKLFTYLFIMLLISITVSQAERYSISAIDGSKFPEIRAYFQAFDNAGNSVENLKPEDFNVFEDGISMDPSLQVVCEEGNKEVSVLLILDRSESMKDTVSTDPLELRWDWVDYAVRTFVKKINFVGRTTVAITNFGGTCKITCPFTNNREELLDSLDKIQIVGKTIYDYPFLDPTAGAVELFKTRPDDVRKVAIFLTDGEPTEQPKTDEIINEMQLANIQVYSITLNTPKNIDLNSISRFTGGESWRVDTKKELDDIYNKLAEKLQTQLFCYLSWVTKHGCDQESRYRNAKFEYLRISINDGRIIERPFILPEKSVPRLLNSRTKYNLGMAQANETISGYVDFTPLYDDFEVTGARFSNWSTHYSVDWEGRTLPFTIKEGQTESIKVVFKQTNIQTRTADLILEGYPCEKAIPVEAGGVELVIDSPSGGESYSLCDSINILWSGINKNTLIDLSYSTNNGNSWDTITTFARGLTHKWMAPREGQYRLRADKKVSWNWVCPIHGTGEDGATGIHESGNIYAVGFFENTGLFGATEIPKNSYGKKDYFLMSIKPNNGEVNWVTTNGGTQNDSATAVYNDGGTYYVTGSTMDNITFGAKKPNFYAKDKRHLFVAKHDATGKAIDGNILGIMSSNQNKDLEMWGTKVAVVGEYVYIEGEYVGFFDFGSLSLPKTTVPKTFTVTYNKSDLVLKDVKAGSLGGINYPPRKFYHDTYYATKFSDTLRRFNDSLVSKGNTDGVIIKSNSRSSKETYINSQNFAVVSPEITFNANYLDAGDCSLGNSVMRLLTAAVKNNGSIAVSIESEVIVNDPLGEFAIEPSLLGTQIAPGGSLDVTVVFTPKEVGERTAQLLLGVDCLAPQPIALKGNGQCSFEAKAIDFKEVPASVNKTLTNVCVFENLSNDSLIIQPVIEGADAAAFILSKNGIFSVQPGECWTVDITCYSSVAGPKSAYINFNLPEACADNHATLDANIVITDVVVEDINWGNKRVSSINPAQVILQNNSNIDLKVISLSNTTPSSAITMTNPPANFTIPAQGTYPIDVSFSPSAEQYYESIYEFQVENAPAPNTFKLSGTGVIPAYTLNWICPDDVDQGQSSPAYLEIENNGTADLLKIYNITITNGATDYSWVSPHADLEIAKGNKETLELTFSPAFRGSREVVFDIISDALASSAQEPKITNTHNFDCEVPGLLVPSNLNFGNVLVCDDYPMTLSVVNPSSNESVSISSILLQSGEAFYATHESLPYVIAPLDSMLIDLHFNPKDANDYQDILTITDMDNNQYQVQLSGRAVDPVFYANVDTLTVVPFGDNLNGFGVKATFPALKYGAITNFKLEIEVNEELVEIKNINNTKPAGFTWKQAQKTGAGKYIVEGSGNLNTPFDDVFIIVEYKALLGAELVTPFKVRPLYTECPSDFTVPIHLAMNGICFNEGILINQGNFITDIQKVNPNPISTSTDLIFTTGYEAGTKLEIFDMQGNKVETLYDGRLPSGKYSVTLDVEKYNSGAYLLKLHSGHIIKTEKIIISK